jgi:hypothetical protein
VSNPSTVAAAIRALLDLSWTDAKRDGREGIKRPGRRIILHQKERGFSQRPRRMPANARTAKAIPPYVPVPVRLKAGLIGQGWFERRTARFMMIGRPAKALCG